MAFGSPLWHQLGNPCCNHKGSPSRHRHMNRRLSILFKVHSLLKPHSSSRPLIIHHVHILPVQSQPRPYIPRKSCPLGLDSVHNPKSQYFRVPYPPQFFAFSYINYNSPPAPLPNDTRNHRRHVPTTNDASAFVVLFPYSYTYSWSSNCHSSQCRHFIT
jgi:hypothetical protein